VVDLAFVTPDGLHAQISRTRWDTPRISSRCDTLRRVSRSEPDTGDAQLGLQRAISSHERTLHDEEVSGAREALIDCARDLGGTLR